MTDAGPNANITALVEAIDARARQAGSDGAATLLRGMIGSVSEVLASIQDRLDRVEDLLTDRDAGAAPAGGLVEQVQSGLATFNARLGRLEEAFVQAVEDSGSGTDAVVDQLRRTIVEALEQQPRPATAAATGDSDGGRAEAVIGQALDAVAERLDGLEARLAVIVSSPEQLEEAMNPVRARLTGIEQLIRSRGDDRAGDPTAPLRAALAPIGERLDGLEIAVRNSSDASSERIARIDTATAPLAGRLATTEERVAATVAAIEAAAQEAKSAVDPELVARLEAAIEQLSRDESTAKVVGLVEERVGAGVRAVVERSEATGRAVDGLGEAQAELRRRIDEVAETLRSAKAYDDERVVEAVRREAELLTQRVAALAVGVEAARSLLQQHVEETENSLGRKAGSVTRRLAADLGIGGRRGRGGGRDRRQLGPGEH
ncbi:MAG: hypothetical protein QOF60_2193 [Actinomycetota bacterium]|jgi:chaperonin cofactor prefoldin|nr:hypothetical protein [Actinomycetota bacterium]